MACKIKFLSYSNEIDMQIGKGCCPPYGWNPENLPCKEDLPGRYCPTRTKVVQVDTHIHIPREIIQPPNVTWLGRYIE